MSQDLLQRAHAWIVSEDTGLSSETIWATMMGVPHSRPYEPSDPSDLGRCLRLLRAIPEWRERLSLMSGISIHWDALVQRWDELEASFLREAGSLDPEWGCGAPETYNLMKLIENSVRRST